MSNDVLLFIAIGFAAQMIDGAIGMAYGIVATTMLMSFGVPPATASAAIHTAEVFTTAASGTAHWRMGNVDRKLVARLAVPGMFGGAVGAYVLATVPSDHIRPIVSAYLLVMGAVILWRAIWKARSDGNTPKRVGVLGLFGGFLDAIGGGGWGAMVTTTLIGRGVTPRLAIGSANVAEFFVTVTVTATFVATVGVTLWPVITGLVIGGIAAAPFAAYATKHLPDQPVMILVGVVVILLSLRGLLSAFWSRLAALVREGIKTSLANLRTFPCIQTLEGKGRITLHGGLLRHRVGDTIGAGSRDQHVRARVISTVGAHTVDVVRPHLAPNMDYQYGCLPLEPIDWRNRKRGR